MQLRRVALVAALALLATCQPQPTPIVKTAKAPYQYILSVIGRNINLAPPPLPPVRNPDAYGVVDLDGQCATLDLIAPRWTYNYSTHPLECAGVESVPMIQSGAQISNTIASNSDWLMGFNEPDMNCVACWAYQTPEQAAVNWRLIEERYPDKKLVAPSPISGTHYDLLGWLARFYAAYIALYGSPPRLDALAVHIYFVQASDAEVMVQEALNQAIAWDVPQVWVTEWGMALGDPDGMQEATFLDWLQTSGVARYSWFGSSIDIENGIKQGWYSKDWADMSLVKGGALTDFGKVYVNYSGGRK